MEFHEYRHWVREIEQAAREANQDVWLDRDKREAFFARLLVTVVMPLTEGLGRSDVPLGQGQNELMELVEAITAYIIHFVQEHPDHNLKD